MQVLLNKSFQGLSGSIAKSICKIKPIYTSQTIFGKSICPCCSYTLLRHISLRGIYWRCGHCHQEMPVYSVLN